VIVCLSLERRPLDTTPAPDDRSAP